MDPDLELLERWRAGDKAAGQELFKRHYDDIYGFLEHKVGDDGGAELAQATFMKCVKARDQFRGQSTFRTYLFSIARNELYDFLRRRRRDEPVDFGVTSIAEVVTSPSRRFDRAQQKEQLRAALLQLPADQQLLLELHYWYDHDAQALAEVFETTSGAIRVRLLRARRALRDRMADAGWGTGDDRLAAALSRTDDDDDA
jgi:RNA polymerase sigma-70 factor (ECF subfamily)